LNQSESVVEHGEKVSYYTIQDKAKEFTCPRREAKFTYGFPNRVGYFFFGQFGQQKGRDHPKKKRNNDSNEEHIFARRHCFMYLPKCHHKL
jgi:hypothetical protein